MNSFKQRVEKQFNRASSTYDQYADIQREMADQLMTQVKRLKPAPRRILEIGCGTGILTKQVIQAFPQATILAVDLAESMVQMARNRVSDSKKICFLVGDAETMDFGAYAPVDCIVSNATIQWFSHPQQTVSALAENVSSNGWLCFTTFGSETFTELKHLFLEVESQMGLKHSQHTLPLFSASTWQHRFTEVGLSDVSVRLFHRSVIYPDCLRFLRSIQKIGARYGSNPHPPLQSSRLLSEVIRRYDQRYRTPNGVHVTYEWLLIRGKKSGKNI